MHKQSILIILMQTTFGNTVPIIKSEGCTGMFLGLIYYQPICMARMKNFCASPAHMESVWTIPGLPSSMPMEPPVVLGGEGMECHRVSSMPNRATSSQVTWHKLVKKTVLTERLGKRASHKLPRKCSSIETQSFSFKWKGI